MEDESGWSLLVDFVSKHSTRIEYFEKLAVFILSVGLILFSFKSSVNNIILIIGSVLTALVYLLFVFRRIGIGNNKQKGILYSSAFISFIYKIVYSSLCLAVLTILITAVKTFPSLKALNADAVVPIIVSGFNLVAGLIFSLLIKHKVNVEVFSGTFYLRIVLALILLVYLADIQYNLIQHQV